MPRADRTIFAKWTKIAYTVTYAAGAADVSGLPSGSVLGIGDIYTVSSDTPSRTGYNFDGWTATSGISGNYVGGDSITMPADNVVLTARWILKTFTIRFASGTGTASLTGTDTWTDVPYGTLWSAAGTVPSPVAQSHYINPAWTGALPAAGTAITADAIYTVNFELDSHSVTYLSNLHSMGTVPSSQTATHGQTVTVPSASLIRTGYTFLGWDEDATATAATYPAGSAIVGIAKDYILNAVWAKVPYTVSYASGGSNVTGLPGSATAYAGDSFTVSSSAPSRAGYTFNGWVATSGISGNYASGSKFTMPAAGVVLTASWTVITVTPPATFTVSYNGGGSKVTGLPAGATLREGASYKVSRSIPVRKGFTFAGWTMTSGGSGSYKGGDSFIMPAADVVLTASWDEVIVPPAPTPTPTPTPRPTPNPTSNPPVDTFTVSYSRGGGGVTGLPSGATLRAGASYTVSGRVPVRDGFTFAGWTMTSGGSGFYAGGDSFTMPAADVVLTANWEEVIVPAAPVNETRPTPDPSTNTNETRTEPIAQDLEAPATNIFSNVPLGHFNLKGAWSLLSLIMSLIAIIIALLLILGALLRRRNEKDDRYDRYDEKNDRYDKYEEYYDDERERDEEKSRRKYGKVLKVLTIIVGILTPIIWLILDNLNQPMAWINQWTFYVGIAFIITLILLIAYGIRKQKKDKDYDDKDYTEAEDNDGFIIDGMWTQSSPQQG